MSRRPTAVTRLDKFPRRPHITKMPQPIAASSTIQAARDQISRDLEGEALILQLNSGVYYGLDAVGTRIWGLLQQPTTVQAIRATLVAEYDVEPERCEHDLLQLLQQ